MARPADKKSRPKIASIAEFETNYLPKGFRIARHNPEAGTRPTPDLVSDALRSLRQTLR